jgi:hypothetical protein
VTGPDPPAGPRFADALEVLGSHGVELIVVGGVAAVLAGAPVNTFDLDVLYRRSDTNLDRLLAALGDLQAVVRDPAGRRLAPQRRHLAAARHLLLTTRCGPLDLLGRIADELTYEDLLSRSHQVTLRGRTVAVLDLDAVIETKERVGRDKDRAMLPVLRETLRQQRGAADRPASED